MDQIVTLSDGESTAELQKYLSSLTNEQVTLTLFERLPSTHQLSHL